MKSAISWFEIPAANLERAVAFYETLCGTKLRREDMGPMTMAVFPYADPGIGGAVVFGPTLKPNPEGALVYLRFDDIREPLARLAAASGEVLLARTELGDGVGFIAHIRDSEGNRVGLHSAH